MKMEFFIKRNFRVILCILGAACILIGLFQVVSPSYQYNKKQYNKCMQLYESAKLNVQTSLFNDIRQNYADIAGESYGLALYWQDKIDRCNLICIVLCVLGGSMEVAGLYLRKKINNQV